MTYLLVFMLGILAGGTLTNLWYHINWEDKELVAKVMEENDVYYQVMERQFMGQKEGYEEVPIELSRYEEKAIAYTCYNEKDKQYYVVLDFYFSDAEQVRGKSELFLKFDERLQWNTDNATAELWVLGDSVYTRKDDLHFTNVGFSFMGINIRDLNEKDFPLHIQVKLVAAWAEEEMPEKITFEYGLW